MRNKKGGKKQHNYALIIFGLVLSILFILVVSTVGRKEFGSSHKFLLEIIGPAQSVIARATTFFSAMTDDYTALINVREENRQLKDELQKAWKQNIEYREAAATNEGLKRLLQFKEALPVPTLSAQIIGKDPSIWFRTVIVDQGSNDGVLKGMPVATSTGIVGQVLGTSPSYAKILLATDPNSAIDVMLQRTRTRGILKGQGNGLYELHYVLKNEDVVLGDLVVTSEQGGIFPQGLSVGTVSRIYKDQRGMFREIDVEPTTDFSKLENVLIIMKKNTLTP